MKSQDYSKIESLRDYLAVANAFMKANSTLQVQLWSKGCLKQLDRYSILGAARSLSDEHFDWMVFIQDLLKKATD
jgi:hypothetical protein